MKSYLQAILLLAVLAGAIAYGRKEATEAPETTFFEQKVTDSSVGIIQEETRREITASAESVHAPELKSTSGMARIIGGRLLYEHNTSQHWPMASLTKLMTATVALETLPDTPERTMLIKRMMIVSDNAAADTLATQGGGADFIARMNQKAHALGMVNTGFSDASGLSYLNQTTVLDLDKLVAYIMERHPEVIAWSTEPTITIDGTTLQNINLFAGRYDFIGGKTGFTDEANGNLISLFRTNQGTLAIIMLGAPDKNERFIQTELLYEWLSQHFRL